MSDQTNNDSEVSALLNKYSYILDGQSKKNLTVAKITESIVKYYEGIIDNMPGNVYWLDKNGVALGCNKNVLEMFGLKTLEEFRGLTFEEMGVIGKWSAKATESFKRDTLEVARTGLAKLNIEEPPIPHSNGTIIYFLTSRVPFFDSNKNVIAVIGISININDRKRAEEELHLAKKQVEQAQLANEIKTQFIQNVQHDLYTPAASISQVLQMLYEKEDNTEQKNTLKKVANASRRLLDLLNDIAAFDKISSGQLPLAMQKLDIHDVVNNIIEIETPKAQLKKLHLQLEIAKNVPQIIISDKNRIFRILLNLVSNAVKFTKKGHVKIIVSIAKQISPSDLLLKMIVEDTGIGIPANKIGSIYKRFEQVTPSNNDLYADSGLGLSITRQFLNELQGEIKVSSIEGLGTKFTCLLPCSLPLSTVKNCDSVFETHTASEEKFTTSVNSKFSNTKVLFIEDDELIQMAARYTLEDQLNLNLTLAKSGKEFLKFFRKNHYDLILTDLGLPDTTGYDIAKHVRKNDKDIPIIAITGNDLDEMRHRCKKAGINDFIIKPMDLSKITAILTKWQEQKYKNSLPSFCQPVKSRKSKSKNKANKK